MGFDDVKGDADCLRGFCLTLVWVERGRLTGGAPVAFIYEGKLAAVHAHVEFDRDPLILKLAPTWEALDVPGFSESKKGIKWFEAAKESFCMGCT